MFVKIGRVFMLIIMIFIGLLFAVNIYVLGDTQAAIAMHDDLPRSASAMLANTKVILSFIVGLLYLFSAYSIIRKKYKRAFAGVVGCVLFNGFYIFQLIMWSGIHPRMWIDFSIFGSINLLIGVYSGWNWWNNRRSVIIGG